LTLVDLTGEGNEEFALVTGQYHATEVRAETLTVWQLDGKSFRSLFVSPGVRVFGVDLWWYERQYVQDEGVTRLRLVLKHDPVTPRSVDKSLLDPSNRVYGIRVRR
jgi:hypothetical protein